MITFVAFAYLARIFGPVGFGYIEWAGTVLMCTSLIVDQGFSAYGAREIAKFPDQTPRLVREIVTARVLLAGLGYSIIVIFALFFVRDESTKNLLLVYGLSLWTLPFLLQWVFQGQDRMGIVAVTQLVRQSIFVTAVFLLVSEVNDLVWVGIAELVGVGSAAMVSIYSYIRYSTKSVKLRPAFSMRLFREGTPIGLSQLFWVVKMWGATFIIGLVATAEDTGYFAAAMRIYIALHTFVWLYFFNMLPSLSRAWELGPVQMAAMLRKSIKIVALLSLLVGVIWIATAPFVMTTVYGPDFSPGAEALSWLGGACIAAAFSGHFRYGLIAAGYQSREMLAMGLGTLIALILIPIGYFYAGISGSAAALFFVECIVLFLSWLIAKRTILRRLGNSLSNTKTSLKSALGIVF